MCECSHTASLESDGLSDCETLLEEAVETGESDARCGINGERERWDSRRSAHQRYTCHATPRLSRSQCTNAPDGAEALNFIQADLFFGKLQIASPIPTSRSRSRDRQQWSRQRGEDRLGTCLVNCNV